MRDYELEAKLQNKLVNGSNIWVVGDVHGHFKTLQALVEKLQLKENDAVVMLGDLIDRGPTSADVVKLVKMTGNFYSVRGNHEQMMIEGFHSLTFFKDLNMESRIWYHNGGCNTEFSYTTLYGDEDCERAAEDAEWMAALPTEIVLDDWRIVHAGYDQNDDVDGQPEDSHMHVRKQFYTSKKPIDPKRTVLFGHTVTFKHLHKDDSKAGLVWFSDIILDDARPMAIGLDTCLYHKLELPQVLSAYNIQNNEVIYQNRV